MLSNGRNDLKKAPTLEEMIMMPITVPFRFSPEMKCPGVLKKHLKITDGSSN